MILGLVLSHGIMVAVVMPNLLILMLLRLSIVANSFQIGIDHASRVRMLQSVFVEASGLQVHVAFLLEMVQMSLSNEETLGIDTFLS